MSSQTTTPIAVTPASPSTSIDQNSAANLRLIHVTLTITEEQAACIVANRFHGTPDQLEEICTRALQNAANEFAMAFPLAVKYAVKSFREGRSAWKGVA